MTPEDIEVLYQDNYLIAINKPHGLLVHRTKIAEEREFFALQLVRDLTGKHIHTIHRIDRGTGGVLLFAFDKISASTIASDFENRKINKTYLAITRGHLENEGIIQKPLSKENSKTEQEAITEYTCLEKTSLPIQIDKYPTSRFSLGLFKPKTGRFHQIRRHLNHISNPIIGDYRHGDFRQNHFFRDEINLNFLMLHAIKIEFTHPILDQTISISAPIQQEFKKCMEFLSFSQEAALRHL